MIKDFLTKKITRANLDKFISKHGSDKLTLDLGCSGTPNYAKYFKNRIGLDIKDGEGVDVVGDAHNLPFPDGKFDVIVCTEVLEHLHTPHTAVSEMNRVLKPGGKLILTTRFIFPIHDAPHDYYRYTKYGLKHLFKEWEIVELSEEVGTKDTFAVLTQRIGYQCKLKINKISKILIFLLAKIIYFLPSMIKDEYGDIGRRRGEKNILTSGYYMFCRKR
jgi:SAM-dependent methyltransferase